jgi:glycosyltransferase involved in cell wall biosynthesis
MARREQAEWELADLVLCGSAYVKEAVERAGGPADRCRVVPYGYDLERAPSAQHSPICREPGPSRPLRVLFAGTLCLRKGAPYLLEAARRVCGDLVQWRAVGPSELTASARGRLAAKIELTGAVSRARMDEHYAWADVLVLPSISEGSANVCYEALARGLPVITTPNAGSVVRHGVDGFIVPIRDAAAIADRLVELAGNRARLAALSRSAAQRSLDFTSAHYAQRLLAALDEPDAARTSILEPILETR